MGEFAKKIMAENPNESRSPYFPVPINQFEILNTLNIPLFLKIGPDFVEYISQGEKNKPSLFQHLKDRQITTVYVHLNHRRELFRETEKYLHDIIKSPNLELKEKAEALHSAAVCLIEDIFDNPENSKRLKDTRPLVENQVKLIQDNPKAFFFLSNLGAHDYYTYTHSIGVASYSIAYFIADKSCSESDLIDIGQGSLLHDVGKAKIPWDIINKKDGLTEDEWLRLKQHPALGDAILKNAGMTNKTILAATRHHHENYDGSGYPDGLKGDSIPLVAQIVGFADVFNALTTNRSYSNARTSFEAFKFMKEHLHGKFKEEVFTKFLMLFKE